MSFDVQHAVARNEYWNGRLQWNRHWLSVCELLSIPHSSSRQQLAHAVYRWQKSPSQALRADGIVGPDTWRRIRRSLGWRGHESGPGYVRVDQVLPRFKGRLWNFDIDSSKLNPDIA